MMLNGFGIFMLMSLSSHAWAAPGDRVSTGPAEVRELSYEEGDASRRFEAALSHIYSVLSRFRPHGVRYENLSVLEEPNNRAVMSFDGLLLGMDLRFVGKANVAPYRIQCKDSSEGQALGAGYQVLMRVDESDSMISRNFSEMQADLCLLERQGGIRIRTEARMIEGPSRSVLSYQKVRGILSQQVGPLLDSLVAEMARE